MRPPRRAQPALGAWQLRGSLSGPVDLKIIRANWHFGKWLAGSDLVGDLLYNQVFVYMAAAVSGVTAAGILKAVNTVFGPSRVLIAALNMALPVHFARALAAEGTDGLYQKIKQVYGAALPLLGGYCLIAGAFAGPLLRLFYGSRYADQSTTLRLYAALTLIGSVGLISCCAPESPRVQPLLLHEPARRGVGHAPGQLGPDSELGSRGCCAWYDGDSGGVYS